MQVTKKNVDILKPGMLVLVSGQKVRFVKNGAGPYQLIFEKVDAKENDGHMFIDLSWYEPFIITVE
ncbi:MAG: hypothetical protein IKF97_03340 [Clostridia bacterium]|nr:hypothetical protein [Clostridia bacterium]